MHIRESLKTLLRRLIGTTLISHELKYKFEDASLCTGRLLEAQFKNIKNITTFRDIEYKVFSQWGDDGIISWIVEQLEIEDPFFVEFGVQTYEESNTRFLLQNRNWSGLIIDGNKVFIDYIRNDRIYLLYNLRAENLFITKDNINKFLESNCPKKDIDLLSIDIDGNDYWILQAITSVTPKILICEYNSLFGDKAELTVPYRDDFYRTNAHYSNLYFGASVKAIVAMAESKGYSFLGTNSNGNNAYFIRNDLISIFDNKIVDKKIHKAKFRESRNINGELTFLNNQKAFEEIKELPIFDLKTSKIVKLKEIQDK